MGLGRKYFLRCSWSMGDILVIDHILFLPILGFVVLILLILYHEF